MTLALWGWWWWHNPGSHETWSPVTRCGHPGEYRPINLVPATIQGHTWECSDLSPSHYVDTTHVTCDTLCDVENRERESHCSEEIPILIKSSRNANLKRNDVNLTWQSRLNLLNIQTVRTHIHIHSKQSLKNVSKIQGISSVVTLEANFLQIHSSCRWSQITMRIFLNNTPE